MDFAIEFIKSIFLFFVPFSDEDEDEDEDDEDDEDEVVNGSGERERERVRRLAVTLGGIGTSEPIRSGKLSRTLVPRIL